MKSIRNIAFSALFTIGAFTAITYTSCNKDECKDVVCNNGGSCVNGACNCPTGYEGTNCEILTRAKFLGTWSGADQCNSGTYTIDLEIDPSSNDVNAIVSNVGGFGTNVNITGQVSSTNQLVFSNQNVGGGRVLDGTMTFNGNAMQFNYTIDGPINDDSCNGNYVKK